MEKYDLLNRQFLLIKDKLENDKIFFHLERLVGDSRITYGAEAMVLLDMNTYGCVTVAELERNSADQLRELLAIRMSDACEGVIEGLKEIQVKLERERHGSTGETKADTDKSNGSEGTGGTSGTEENI